MAFFQFLHNDFTQGMKVKRIVETITFIMQLFFIFSIVSIIISFREISDSMRNRREEDIFDYDV